MRYEYKCWKCGDEKEVSCPSSEWESRVPSCPTCMSPMNRNFHSEQFGGITHRNKGVYPLTDADIVPGGMVFDSYEHHARELKSRGLAWKPEGHENQYRRRHARDFESDGRR